MAIPVPAEKELHRIAITGIVWKKDADGVFRYLVTKRAPTKKMWPNKWTVPGGGMQTDDYVNEEPTYGNSESPQWYGVVEKALRREIQEETGVEVADINYLLDLAFVNGGSPCLVLSMYCRYVSGEVVLDEDATEFAWITAEEAKAYDLIHGIADEIAQVEQRLSAA
ncbi:MAG TPA: NUDIX domain-containing protein [Candidatus Paceibacterota bacterium]